MEDNIQCNLCGGTDFYNEAGHYYCKECQTQSQDIQEHVFAVPDETATARHSTSKRIRTKKKTEDCLTSWECYNYIVVGLVNELIELGANAKLKQVVKILWFKYLSKLEVIRDDPNAPPKLPAVNSQMDAGIIYGRNKKKRKKSRTPSPSSSSEQSGMDASLLRKEKAKQRRSLILAQYDEYNSTLKSEDISLHSQSLQSLKSGSDTSSKEREKYLSYNKNAKKELLNLMPKHHLKVHCRDVDSLLDCHKISYRDLSWKYTHGADVLSRNRIYAILYLGLLIIKDKIQLGDMIRFVREGSLSYHEVHHFFPDELNEKNLNIKSWNLGNSLLTHNGMRMISANVAKLIDVVKYVPRQNLIQLCERYCNELNLPREIMGYTVNLMSKAVPKLKFTSRSKCIPNYEGRVVSMIIFIVKLMFGLDDVTEYKFSAYAENLNCMSDNLTNQKTFVWKQWMQFIQYRKLVLMQHHFPTNYFYDNENNRDSDLFPNFRFQTSLKYEKDLKLNREGEVIKRLLEKLKDKQSLSQEPLNFLASLTPLQDYLEVLINSTIPRDNNYLTEILMANFKDDSLDFLTKPIGYLEETNKITKVGIKHGGANKNIKLIKIENTKVKREIWRKKAKKEVFVLLSNDNVENDTQNTFENIKLKESVSFKLNTKEILQHFEIQHMSNYKNTLNKLMRTYNKRKQKLETNAKDASPIKSQQSHLFCSQNSEISSNMPRGSQVFDDFPFNSQESQDGRRNYIHYNPHERFWLKTSDVSEISRAEFNEFFAKFPESFKVVLSECGKITEQHLKDLYQEYSLVEVYLCYVAQFTESDKHRDKITNNDLTRFINKAKKNW